LYDKPKTRFINLWNLCKTDTCKLYAYYILKLNELRRRGTQTVVRGVDDDDLLSDRYRTNAVGSSVHGQNDLTLTTYVFPLFVFNVYKLD